jgi:hypothetical protein
MRGSLKIIASSARKSTLILDSGSIAVICVDIFSLGKMESAFELMRKDDMMNVRM